MSRLPQKAAEYAGDAMGRDIRAQMARAGMTQLQLGAMAGISQGTVSARVRDPSSLTIREFCRFNKALRLDPRILLEMCGYTRREVREALDRVE